jgi:integrase
LNITVQNELPDGAKLVTFNLPGVERQSGPDYLELTRPLREPGCVEVLLGTAQPPANMAAPSTSRIFPTMEPAIDAFTTSSSPARNAASAIMSSAALPKVALSSPPTPSPKRSASCSVARPIHPARGRMAREQVMKTRRCRSGARITGDGALKGFAVRMKASGVAAYLIQYRNKEGRTRRLALGRVGTLTPEQARALAADKLHEVAKGGDPSAERHATREAMTVSELCDFYLKDAKGRIKESTLAMDRSRIERHVKPLIGRRGVARLTLADVEKMQADIAAGKTAKARPEKGQGGKVNGGRGVAARTIGMLSTMLEFARRHKIIETNPARGARKFPDKKRTRFLSMDELAALGRAMGEAEAKGRSRTGIAVVRALALSGCRRDEILTLPWAWFDAKARCIRFADTKSGAQIRPLGVTAVEHLLRQPRQCEFVFPAERGDRHFVGIARVLRDLCDRAALRNVSPHTFRHTFASIAAKLGFSELTIAGLLGQAARGITQRYSHVPDSALLVAADRVSVVSQRRSTGTRPCLIARSTATWLTPRRRA